LENNSSRGQAVYDPFCGSGTTIIAAEQTGRACHAIEIAPAYVDVAVKRWQAFTGLEAELDGDGRSFEEIALERAAQVGGPSRRAACGDRAGRTLLAETPSPRNRELCESRSFDLGCDLTG